ncbi:hypothetical protein K490DRAFT_20855, partial [Saccharata proteae CBS 121410]
EVASKVLRRAQVSKMTRALQNRLALANVKIKHGWENLSIDSIEPRIEMELKRKRPASSIETMSDSSSSISDRFHPLGLLDSSPLAAPIFSDDFGRSGGSFKRVRYQQPSTLRRPASSNHARTRVRTASGSATTWKSSYRLPESSPAYRKHAHFSVPHAPTLSFVSEGSTIADDPPSPLMSETDDDDLPVSSFQLNSSHMRSSPPIESPRTPPPGLARSARLRNDTFTTTPRNHHHGAEDASLLMYLATSPSPAHPNSKTRAIPPSTPPQKQTPLPSSMMTTPGAGAFNGFGYATPGANLNFADFLNMTPSPAQIAGSWNRTPVPGKTPLAAREARRRLNFDTLLPPTGNSPNIGSHDRARNGKMETGLGMDLGGELVS